MLTPPKDVEILPLRESGGFVSAVARHVPTGSWVETSGKNVSHAWLVDAALGLMDLVLMDLHSRGRI